MAKRIFFLLFEGCEGLSYAGPQQAFHEANQFGAGYEMHFCGLGPSVKTEQGLTVSGLEPLPEVTSSDLVVIAGYTPGHAEPPPAMVRWLAEAWKARPTLVSVCTGAFFLGMAGILDGRTCTTHWKRYEMLQRQFPRARVVRERLFVHDNGVYTGGGGASAIDLALHLIDLEHGPRMAARVAHEMVVYFRRDADAPQTSVYLDYRSHLNPAIHTLQDLVGGQPEDDRGLEDWAKAVGMSARNLTRAFRQATGISFHEYRTKVRLERAAGLLNNPELTVDAVAAQCGFADGRHLRRLWRQSFGTSPKGREATDPANPPEVTPLRGSPTQR